MWLPAGRLNWMLDVSKEQWMSDMQKDGKQADECFIQLTAELLNRQITIIPVFPSDGHAEGNIILNPGTSSKDSHEPLYVLYYSESTFVSGHYQSIRPIITNESLEDMPPPIFESTKTSTQSDSRSKKKRELSYMDEKNIILAKRPRK